MYGSSTQRAAYNAGETCDIIHASSVISRVREIHFYKRDAVQFVSRAYMYIYLYGRDFKIEPCASMSAAYKSLEKCLKFFAEAWCGLLLASGRSISIWRKTQFQRRQELAGILFVSSAAQRHVV